MEPITLVETALAIASPYLKKTGEKVAEKIGENVWSLIKKPFNKVEENQLFPESPNDTQLENIKEQLLVKIQNDESYKEELKKAINDSKTNLNQQYVNNQGGVENQVNIQTNTGDIRF